MTAAADIKAPSPAEQLRERFWKLKRSRIYVSSAHTSRASSIGHDCERFLVYERTKTELREPHKEWLQALFDLGNHAEKFVIRELEEMGIDVLERSRDYHDRELELTGHIDAKLRWAGSDRIFPAEVKGLNPFSMEKIRTIDDIKGSRQAWIRKYYAQLQAYLYFEKRLHPELGDPHGVFALLNKVSGQIEFIDCPYDAEFAEGLIAKAGRIRDAIKADVLPERHQTHDCTRCPFVHVCLPDVSFGQAVEVLDKDELIEAIRRREEFREAHAKYSEADRAVKALLPEKAGEMLIGPYAVVGKEVVRKAYSVKASTYVQFDVRLIGPAPTPTDEKPLNPFGQLSLVPNDSPKESK